MMFRGHFLGLVSAATRVSLAHAKPRQFGVPL
jgi:hypothetical protein